MLPTKDSGTRNIYRLAFRKFEKAVSPGYVDAIRTATIDKYVRVRLAEKKMPSPATINKELHHLKAAFKKAFSWEMLPKTSEVVMLRELQRAPYFVDDNTFKALYGACDALSRPAERNYPVADWWQALLCFAYMTGWRIGEILDLRHDDLDLENGIAIVDAESTKGKREARIELHPVVIEHLRRITEFTPLVFDWPHHGRKLWADFARLKEAAEVEFPGAFHRLRFGFANANVDSLDADLLQELMRHRDPQTTRKYINVAQRMRRAGTAERLHVPDVLKIAAG